MVFFYIRTKNVGLIENPWFSILLQLVKTLGFLRAKNVVFFYSRKATRPLRLAMVDKKRAETISPDVNALLRNALLAVCNRCSKRFVVRKWDLRFGKTTRTAVSTQKCDSFVFKGNSVC